MSGILTGEMVDKACEAYENTPTFGELPSATAMRAALEAVLPMIGQEIAQRLSQEFGKAANALDDKRAMTAANLILIGSMTLVRNLTASEK